jgi:hypothetical protein
MSFRAGRRGTARTRGDGSQFGQFMEDSLPIQVFRVHQP